MRARIATTLILLPAFALGACVLDSRGESSDPTGDPSHDPTAEDPGAVADPTPPVDPFPVPDALIREWSGCMSLPNFEASNMAPAWSSLAGSAQCTSCHSEGSFGFIATPDEAVFFKAITENRYHLLAYFRVDAAAAKIITNARGLEAVSDAEVPHAQHPRFDPDQTGGMTALEEFYDLTVARKAAGECDPPRLLD
jgi:hypothetical protein